MREERWPLSLVRKVERIVRDPVGKWQLSLSPEPEVDAILDAVFSGAGTSHVLEKAAPVCGDKRKRAPSTLLGTPAFVEAREEDSDVDVRPVKSQVRLRLFDSEEREDVPAPLVLSGNPIQISDSESPATPVSTRKLAKGRPKKKARRLQAATNVSVIEALEIELESCPDLTDLESLSWRSAADIKMFALRWLGDIDTARAKSGRIQGKLSGQMKKRIDSLKKVVEIMSERVKDVGDVAFLRQRNSELVAQVRYAQPTADKLRKDLAEAEERVRVLQEEVDVFKRRIGSRSLSPMPMDVVTRERESPKPQRKQRNRVTERDKSANSKVEGAQYEAPLVGATYQRDDPVSSVGPSYDPVPGPSGVRPADGAPGPAEGLAAHLDVLKQYDDRIMTQVEMLLRLRDEIHHGGVGGSGESGRVATEARARPRILENVLLAPSSFSVAGGSRDNLADGTQPGGDNEEWQRITRRRKKKRGSLTAAGPREPGPSGDPRRTGELPASRVTDTPARTPRRRPPRTAAVAIKIHSGVKKTYGEVLRQARQALELETFGITDTRVRRTANGGTLIEIPGPDGASKADLLAGHLRTALEGEASVSRPVVKGELRLSGFDDSVSVDEISALIVDLGGCAHSDIRIGPFRPLNSGLLAVWLQCPLAAATKANTNRSWRSRDLLLHNLLELEIDVCYASELQSVPQNNPQWFASNNQLAAIYWNMPKIGALWTISPRCCLPSAAFIFFAAILTLGPPYGVARPPTNVAIFLKVGLRSTTCDYVMWGPRRHVSALKVNQLSI
ncbi:hypothetical protein DMN91_002838 [Ooceraea biroi]|uniref:Gag-like protein n=1 Tax=Ooceraea biroi TaxID=2015173 RepID=A0A3L8DY56_OOCBI|nr:hypothetical protein DMN91_002838 [Ooceraea biroi]